MTTFKSEGVILKALDFQDYDKILTIFSEEEGIIKLIAKRANSQKQNKGIITSPFTQAEFIYTKNKSTLWKSQEISIVNQHLILRQNLSWIEIAAELIQAILLSQLEHKPSSQLYRLLILYLEKIPYLQNPYTLISSFLLKILRHEGLIASENTLTFPNISLNFCEEETVIAGILLFSRSFSQLNELDISPTFSQKIKLLFQNLIHY